MRGEIVLYIQQEEGHRLMNELDSLLRRVYGENLTENRQQMTSQVPKVLDFLLNLAQFMPNAIDITEYLSNILDK